MDIRGILSDKKFLNVAKEISFDELLTEPLNKDPSNTIIGYINQFSLYKKFKLIFKRYLIDFLNLFLKEKKIYQKSRSVEEVKLKYEKIAGSYIDEFYDHEKSEDGTLKKKNFVGFNHHENKIYLIKGGSPLDPTINIVSKFCNHHNLKSLIEVGAGELTTLYPVIKKIKNLNFISALELSPNRLKHGNLFLKEKGIHIDHLIACDASNIPYENNSFDISFTQYCIEQVPQLAKKIIDEMIRISSKYVIIIEPSFQFSNKITKNRILYKGFPMLKDNHFKNLNAKIIYRDGLPFTRYALYSEITILEKITKNEGKPILRHPTNYKKIELNNEFMIYGENKIKINDGIIDFSKI
jgi:ubiquinone/menaquinone biosynthesis C-methylase UbiE